MVEVPIDSPRGTHSLRPSVKRHSVLVGVEALETRRLLDGGFCAAADVALADEGQPVTSQYTVKHPPRLQLGDAPLTGFPGSDKDQVDILWQTISAGEGTQDVFTVDYRRVGDEGWIRTAPADLLDTGVETRVIHQVPIRGLDFDSAYEYRVQHVRAGTVIDTYQAQFQTRLAAGDPSSFTFAAYGDSAYIPTINNFRSVQSRINQLDPDFALLLGDNAYLRGLHPEFDARFDLNVNPEAATWISSHIDYFGIGNHDGAGFRSKTSQENFSVPIPKEGVTAPAELITIYTELNYSFDYGDVHFVSINTNAYSSPGSLNAILDYAAADLNASDAKWKIVFGHHAVGGSPDKPQTPSDNYFSQVVPRLRAAGADLLLVSHSHTYHWTYPLLGQVAGEAIFVPDTDKDYEKDAGLIQVTSGMGGMTHRPGSFEAFPFSAAGFTRTTQPASEWGFANIQVTPNQLTVSYVAAEDGRIIDEFTITEPQARSQIAQVFVRGSTWSAEFLEQLQIAQLGDRELGFAVRAGKGQATPLPWNNMDQISIVFRENVAIQRDLLRVTSLGNGQPYELSDNGFRSTLR